MNIPPTPPRNRLIIPGAPAEDPNESVDPPHEEAPTELEDAVEPMRAQEEVQEEAYEETQEEADATDEFVEQAVESVDDEAQAEAPVEGEEDDFLMVGGESPEEQGFEQTVQNETPPEIAVSEAKTIRRLLPRGAVHDDTAPVPRRFSSFQTSAVSVATGQVPPVEEENYQEHAEQQQTAHGAAPAVTSAAASPAIQQQRAAFVHAKSGLPGWIFSLIGFLFGVVTILSLVKLGVMPAALGLTDQKSLREAVKDERARIIKVLEKDDLDPEDWNNFEEDKD